MKTRDLQARLQQFEGLCREHGLPLTIQRRQIFREVLARDDHPTADQVYEAVGREVPGLSRTTVYRVLDTLVELGVVRRLHHPGASSRFDGRIERHHHLVCRVCHCVLDVAGAQLDELALKPSQRHGFRVEDHTVHFIGVCPECRRKSEP